MRRVNRQDLLASPCHTLRPTLGVADQDRNQALVLGSNTSFESSSSRLGENSSLLLVLSVAIWELALASLSSAKLPKIANSREGIKPAESVDPIHLH